MKSILLFYICAKLLLFATGEKILAIQIVPTRSYANVMSSVINHLAQRHEVIYYSITDKVYNRPNVTLIHVPEPEHLYMDYSRIFEQILKKDDTSEDAEELLMSITPEYVENFLKMDIFTELLAAKGKYDALLMCYNLAEFIIPFSHYLEIPVIQISTSSPCPWQNELIGNPSFLSYDSTLISPEIPDNFFNRIKNFMKHVRAILRYKWFHLPAINEVVQKYFPANTPSLETVAKNTSLLLVNTVEAMGYSRPVVSNYIEIGGLHCKPAKPLPKDIEDFIQGSGDSGVIYFSLGSTFQAQMPDRITKAFINVFKKLPQRIIWKVNGDMDDLPENIKVLRWCPQQDILGHNKTKLFITQGGILSLQEAVYHGVPVLVVPIALDQPANAKTVAKLGYGRYLPFTKFSEDVLLSELQELLTQSNYRNKAKHISILMKDVQNTSSEKLNWWVDYIIRHKGLPLYRAKDDRYSWINNLDIDIILFIQFCFLFTCILIVIFIQVFFKYLYNYNILRTKNKTKTS